MSGHFIRIFGVFLAGCVIAGAAEFEINLVRNAAFRPGLGNQGPRDWTYYSGNTNGILDAGRGYVEFLTNGMTVTGKTSLHQFQMWDDVTPQYRFSCRLKSEGGKGSVFMQLRDRETGYRKEFYLTSGKAGVWEDMAMEVGNGKHYGFGVGINVPANTKLSISDLLVTPILKPATDADAKILIADNGQYVPVRGICLRANPNWAEQLAAHELRVNACLAAGVVLPVLAGEVDAAGKGYIRLTNLKKVIPDRPAQFSPKRWWQIFTGRRQPPATAPDANGFRIACSNGNVDVIGGNDAGLLAGAVRFSEMMGVRYYAPRVLSITTNHMLKIPAVDIAKQPAFEWADGQANHDQTWTPWKYGFLYSESCVAPSDKAAPPDSGGWVHAASFLAPPFFYAKTHPDYYALVGGKRLEGYRGRNAGDMQLCLGSPALQKHVAERIELLMDMYPQTKYFAVTQGDGLQWCECDLCTALDVKKTVLTDRMAAFANAVAELTGKKHPDRKLLFLAYAKDREDVPLREKLHKNVAVMYAFWPSSWDWVAPVYSKQNERGLKLLNDWNAFTGTNLTIFMYPVNTYENAEKIKVAAEKGIRGFYHCGWRGDFPEVTIYTTGRLIWEPDADVEKLIDEVMPHIYGAAAPDMRKYFDMHHGLIRERSANPEQYRKYAEPNTVAFRRLPMDYATKTLDLMTKAENAAGNDEYILMKIQTEKQKILYAYINEFLAIHPDVPNDQFEGYALKMAELVRLSRKCRVPFAGYNTPFPEWLYQTTHVLDFDRGPYTWINDKKVDLFLADPVKTLKTRAYLQQKITNGWELPPKALWGGQYLENYQGKGHAGVIIRRKSSSIPLLKAYWKLDALPEKEAELHVQGFDNEKPEKAEIVMKINGHEIFKGPVDFPKNKWDWRKYKVPREYLKQGENVVMIENITKDYKADMDGGQAGPAEEAMAKNYNWGWCMVGTLRLTGWSP